MVATLDQVGSSHQAAAAEGADRKNKIHDAAVFIRLAVGYVAVTFFIARP
jgi:hypothetical protein